MTFIMDMASGTEQDGENMLCPGRRSGQPDQPEAVDRHGSVALQLAIIEPGTDLQPSQPLIVGLDIESLIRSVED